MKYEEAIIIAERTLAELRPHCYRCEIAGSVRRKKPEVKDIDIVAWPKPYGFGLLESGIATVVNQWKLVKGRFPCKSTQRILPEGINLDLFFADKNNWGYIFAIRTGSVEYNQRVLAPGWVKKGYKGVNGYLTRDNNGELRAVPEERDLFRIIGIPFVEPEQRDFQ